MEGIAGTIVLLFLFIVFHIRVLKPAHAELLDEIFEKKEENALKILLSP